jgi:hypothetical protein
MAVRDLPWIKFFPADWLSDEKLRLCSLGARGLWLEMLCLMHKNTRRRGYLEHASGAPVTVAQIARAVSIPTAEAEELVNELEGAGVFSRDDRGVIYSRRLVAEQSFREACSAAGKKGGGNPDFGGENNPGKRQGKGGHKGDHKGTGKGVRKGGTKPQISDIRIKDIAADAATDAPKAPEHTPEPAPGPAPEPAPTPKARPRNPLFDALADVTGSDPTVNGSHVGKLSALLSKATPAYTPDDVREFARRWRELLPWARPSEHPRLTLGIVEKHIHALRSAPKPAAEVPRYKTAADNPLLFPLDPMEN